MDEKETSVKTQTQAGDIQQVEAEQTVWMNMRMLPEYTETQQGKPKLYLAKDVKDKKGFFKYTK